MEWGSHRLVLSEPPPGQWLFQWSSQTGLPPAWRVFRGGAFVEKMAFFWPISYDHTNVLESLLTG